MIFPGLVLLLTLFSPTSTFLLDCEISQNKTWKYLGIFIKFTSKESGQFCGVLQESSDKSQRLNFSRITVFYALTSGPFLPLELYQEHPSIVGCILYNISQNSVERHWFKHSQKLEVLMISGNKIPFLNAEIFIDLENLRILYLLKNLIEEIDGKAFAGLRSLKTLELNSNKIRKLHPDIFKELISLKNLDLDNNLINTVSPRLFRPLSNLGVLTIGGNPLEALPTGIFDNNSNVTVLILKNNISRIPVNVFKAMKKLQYLEFDNFCASGVFETHDLHPKYTEDLLLPCSCKRIGSEGVEFNLKMILIFSGVVAVLFVLIFLIIYKRNKQSSSENSPYLAFSNIFKSTVTEYINITTIHGLNYIANEGRMMARYFWLVIVLFSMVAFTYYSFNTYFRWRERPVIIGFDEQLTEVFEIPFPAVTFCQNFLFDKKVFDVKIVIEEHNAGKADNASQAQLEAAAILCDSPKVHQSMRSLNLPERLNLEKYLSGRYLSFPAIAWNNIMSVSHSARILSEDGICHTFNPIDAKLIFREDVVDPVFLQQYQSFSRHIDIRFWSMENGYPAGSVNNHPVRVFDKGVNNRLEVKFLHYGPIAENIEKYCRDDWSNYKFFFHHPAEVVSKNYFLVPFNKSIKFLITPKITKTSDSLRSYDSAVRQCYFTGDRQLKFFKIYTKANCELECLTNFTLRYCNCSAFYMPRTPGTNLCRFRQHHACVSLAQSAISNAFQVKMSCDPSAFDPDTICNCWPLCNEVTYKVDTIQSDYGFHINRNKINHVNVQIYFEESQFTAVKRSELYGFIDFISNCGGLMGLFMGISILSIIEIVYFIGYFFYQLLKNFQYPNNQVSSVIQ